ncbi:OmpA family protein [Pinibacter aurantiacus]|uniref:OmpA family protein n=1 Tax=Pinibacter aurantiacus TaxID=2851599 RepID=A0A9E2S9K2_9BACT|nr:OmpA family protein [Pinibacter aurantiacus]MBV4358092.1 OmpA family protein [Pinibacter aurantiacus]
MAFSLLDSVKNYFHSDFISKAASLLGENNVAVSKAVNAGIPAVLAGIIGNAQSDGGTNLLNAAKQAAASGMPEAPENLFSGAGSSLLSTGSSFISSIFGNNSGVIGNLISNFSGIKSSTATSILSAIAPIALGFIGKEATSNNLSASGLTNWLGSQKQDILNALPAGFTLPTLGKTMRPADTAYNASLPPAEKSGTNWLLWLLIAIVLIALLWYLMRSCNKNVPPPPPADTTNVMKQDTTTVSAVPPAAPARESLKVKLPDGTELDAWKGGIEDKLVAFLNDENAKPGKDVWFDFDDLNFETGSAKITPESQKQINNIAAILKAYPKVKIKIGGYTDKTGDSSANMKLSTDRAKATSDAIKAAGAKGAQLLGGEGYGSMYAKAAADASDEERKMDRHISVSVREK